MAQTNNVEQSSNVCERSEYIKQVKDFASYIHKEYIEQSDERILLICAADNDVPGPHGCITHILTGNKQLGVTAVSEMIREKEFNLLFRMARVMNNDDEDFADVIHIKRRHLRRLYAWVSVLALWSLGILILQLMGAGDWFSTITNILVMIIACSTVCWQIATIRRQIKGLQNECKDDRAAKAAHSLATFFEMLKRKLQENDTDDEDE